MKKMRMCFPREKAFVDGFKDYVFVLRWLQGIALTIASGLRCSIFHSSPFGNLPLRFSHSIAYQKERRKRGLKSKKGDDKIYSILH